MNETKIQQMSVWGSLILSGYAQLPLVELSLCHTEKLLSWQHGNFSAIRTYLTRRSLGSTVLMCQSRCSGTDCWF